jgi:arylsulfatase A-like enzyme
VALESDRPFLLWVHLFDPHDPYLAPEGWAGHFHADERLDDWLAEREFLESRTLSNGNEYVPREIVDDYDDLVRFTDAQVGRLLDAVAELGLEERTAVAVLTDHGEGLGQHEELFHGLLWREQVRAAWLLRVPGLAPRRVAEPVSVVDLVPTLLGQVEIPGSGRLLEQASGVDALAEGFGGRPQLSQTGLRQVGFGQEVVYALTRGRWRYHWLREEREALYDLEADPFELEDVAAAHPEVVAALRAELLDLVAEQSARGRELGAGEVRRLDEATLRALEDLGYLGGEGR